MSAIANAKKHFKDKLAGGLLKTSVPEWETDVYFKPSYSMAVEQKIIALQQQNKTVEALVETLMLKALDPEGQPMFKKHDKNALMYEVDPNVIIRVCSEINASSEDYDLEDVEKN